MAKLIEMIQLKLERCAEHINLVEKMSREYLRRHIEGKRIEIPVDGDVKMHISLPRDGLLGFSPVVGDALHNARSVLEHAAYHLSSLTPDWKRKFPAETKVKLANGLDVPTRLFPGASPQAISVVQSWQPYQSAPNDPESSLLYHLNKLWNIDKHQSLLVNHTRLGSANLLTTSLDNIEGRLIAAYDRDSGVAFRVDPSEPNVEVRGEFVFKIELDEQFRQSGYRDSSISTYLRSLQQKADEVIQSLSPYF